MKNYCYICLLTACMAPMSLQAQKAIPYSGEVCVAPLPTVPTTLPGISSDSYAGALPTLRYFKRRAEFKRLT